MLMRFKPSWVAALVGVHEKYGETMREAGWLKFFDKFDGHHVKISRAFSLTFDGECEKIGNLIIHILENSLLEVICLLRIGEKWFKTTRMQGKVWTPYMKRKMHELNWTTGVPRNCLNDPWKDLAYLIQKFISCEGRYNVVFLYYIKLLMHLKG